MADVTGLRANMLDPSLMAVFLVEPPGWTRLEPQSVSGEPASGIDARVHDPLWLLGRQWQFGEFRAEDAGSPVAVHVAWESRPVETWEPSQGGTARPLGVDLLEPAIGREPATPGGPGLRVRAMAGMQFVSMLADADVAVDAPALLTACALEAGPLDELDGAGPAIGRILVGRALDGERLAPILEDVIASAAPTPPPWLTGDRSGVRRRGPGVARLVSRRGRPDASHRRRHLGRRSPRAPVSPASGRDGADRTRRARIRRQPGGLARVRCDVDGPRR